MENVAKMILGRLVILGDVGEMGQVVGILAGPVDVADLVLADGLLSSGNHASANQINDKPTSVTIR